MYLVLYANADDRMERDNHVLVVDWPHRDLPATYYAMDGDYDLVLSSRTSNHADYQCRVARVYDPIVDGLADGTAERVERLTREAARTGDFSAETGIRHSDLADGTGVLISQLQQAIARAYNIPAMYLFGNAPTSTNPCAEIPMTHDQFIIDDPDGEP